MPTYNEVENILDLVEALLALNPEYIVLVVDDDSPDRTWEIVDIAAKKEARLHLLHRKKMRGRGSAGRDGFLRALEMGAEIVIELDADFSHQPHWVSTRISWC